MQGLAMTFVEAPLGIQDRVTIPGGHIDFCKASGREHGGLSRFEKTGYAARAHSSGFHDT